jgi:hypothetical protein
LRATWNVGKGHTRQGLMKVYGAKHVKSWAQEIVVLGMLRKIQHASLLQCLWTCSSNPYYETMTLITGEIVTSDSRFVIIWGFMHLLSSLSKLDLLETSSYKCMFIIEKCC